MRPRHLALVAATAALLGAAVLLLRAVREAAPSAALEARGSAAELGSPGDAIPSSRGMESIAPMPAAVAPAVGADAASSSPAPAGELEQKLREARAGEVPQAEPGATAAERARFGAASRGLAAAQPADPTDQARQDALTVAMAEVNRAYDRGDLDDAKRLAYGVLAGAPDAVRMLRVVVSAACMQGEVEEAQRAYARLPRADRDQMRTRCGRYGVALPAP